jgi:hypothetical protein
MNEDFTVVVGTYGTPAWERLARERAIPSAEAQGVPVVHVHGETLADARNRGLAQVATEFVVHLDADDELEPGYIATLAAGSADLRAPAVRYVHPGGHTYRPWMPQVAGHKHACTADCLSAGNWLVVGTAARAELLRSVGGWEEWPVYEDWSSWLRCWVAGATIEAVPEAVYRAYVRRDSRNRGPQLAEKNRIHHEIVAAVFGADEAAAA